MSVLICMRICMRAYTYADNRIRIWSRLAGGYLYWRQLQRATRTLRRLLMGEICFVHCLRAIWPISNLPKRTVPVRPVLRMYLGTGRQWAHGNMSRTDDSISISIIRLRWRSWNDPAYYSARRSLDRLIDIHHCPLSPVSLSLSLSLPPWFTFTAVIINRLPCNARSRKGRGPHRRR